MYHNHNLTKLTQILRGRHHATTNNPEFDMILPHFYPTWLILYIFIIDDCMRNEEHNIELTVKHSKKSNEFVPSVSISCNISSTCCFVNNNSELSSIFSNSSLSIVYNNKKMLSNWRKKILIFLLHPCSLKQWILGLFEVSIKYFIIHEYTTVRYLCYFTLEYTNVRYLCYFTLKASTHFHNAIFRNTWY